MTELEHALVELDFCTDKYILAKDPTEKDKYRDLCEYWQYSVLMGKFELSIAEINQLTFGENGVRQKGLVRQRYEAEKENLKNSY